MFQFFGDSLKYPYIHISTHEALVRQELALFALSPILTTKLGHKRPCARVKRDGYFVVFLRVVRSAKPCSLLCCCVEPDGRLFGRGFRMFGFMATDVHQQCSSTVMSLRI